MGPFGIVLAGVLSFGVTREDLHGLLAAGLPDRAIVDFIRRNEPAQPLSVEDAASLKRAGASDTVLRAMLESSRTSDAVTPTHPPDNFPAVRVPPADPGLR